MFHSPKNLAKNEKIQVETNTKCHDLLFKDHTVEVGVDLPTCKKNVSLAINKLLLYCGCTYRFEKLFLSSMLKLFKIFFNKQLLVCLCHYL